jgi:hypothetical protein
MCRVTRCLLLIAGALLVVVVLDSPIRSLERGSVHDALFPSLCLSWISASF